MPAFNVTLVHDHPRFVNRRPQWDTIIQCAIHQRRVFGEPFHRFGTGPPAAIFERLRQIPMIKRRHRLDFMFDQRIDEAIVEIEAGADLACPVPIGKTRDQLMLKRYARMPSSCIIRMSSANRR